MPRDEDGETAHPLRLNIGLSALVFHENIMKVTLRLSKQVAERLARMGDHAESFVEETIVARLRYEERRSHYSNHARQILTAAEDQAENLKTTQRGEIFDGFRKNIDELECVSEKVQPSDSSA